MGARASRKSLAPETRLYGVEGRASLALNERHCDLFLGPRKADVGPLGDAPLLIPEVPGEALAVLGVYEAGDFKT